MKILKLMALAAVTMPAMFSCSGGGSSSDSALLGQLPGYFEQFNTEEEKLKEEAQNIKSEAEKAELIKKSEEMKEEWRGKIEKSAKELNGKPIELTESNLKVNEPISLEFDGYFSESNLTTRFKVNGSAEAAAETEMGKYYSDHEEVYLVGCNAEGQEVHKWRVGNVSTENVDGKSVVKVGTPVKFDGFTVSTKKWEDYKAAKAYKLEIIRDF